MSTFHSMKQQKQHFQSAPKQRKRHFHALKKRKVYWNYLATVFLVQNVVCMLTSYFLRFQFLHPFIFSRDDHNGNKVFQTCIMLSLPQFFPLTCRLIRINLC